MGGFNWGRQHGRFKKGAEHGDVDGKGMGMPETQRPLFSYFR